MLDAADSAAEKVFQQEMQQRLDDCAQLLSQQKKQRKMLPVPGHQGAQLSFGEERLKRTLYVGGMAAEVDEDVLRAAFLPFGDIRNLEIPKEKATGLHRGFGFVEFEEEGDAKEAMENMNNAELYGRVLRVNLARSGGFAPGARNKPIWHDDYFFRQEMREKGMEISESFDQDEEDQDNVAVPSASAGETKTGASS